MDSDAVPWARRTPGAVGSGVHFVRTRVTSWRLSYNDCGKGRVEMFFVCGINKTASVFVAPKTVKLLETILTKNTLQDD